MTAVAQKTPMTTVQVLSCLEKAIENLTKQPESEFHQLTKQATLRRLTQLRDRYAPQADNHPKLVIAGDEIKQLEGGAVAFRLDDMVGGR